MVAPVRLAERPAPFDSPDHLFELKYDGFRSLLYLENGAVRLVSRKDPPKQLAPPHRLAVLPVPSLHPRRSPIEHRMGRLRPRRDDGPQGGAARALK